MERLANLMGAAAKLVDDSVERRLQGVLPRGASAPAVLVTVSHWSGLSIDRLRRALGLTHSGAVRAVDRLEADGLVRRRRRGGRDVQLSVTARGRALLARVEAARLEAVSELLCELPSDARRQLEEALAELLAEHSKSQGDLERTCRICSFRACEAGGRRCPVAAAVAESSPTE